MDSDLRKELYKVKLDINKELIDSETGRVKKHLVEEVACPICESEKSSHAKTKDGFDFVRCEACDFIYVNPRLKENISDQFYISSKLMSTLIKLQEQEKKDEEKIKYIPVLEKLECYKGKGQKGSILDIGCSIGNFMELAIKKGWDVTGVELNKKAFNICKEKKLKVYNEKLEKLDLADKYQLVTLFALIEHLYHPNEMLKGIKPLLKEDGNLLLFFPEWDDNWDHPQVNGRAHLMYFDLPSISLLLKNNGYTVVDSWVVDWLKGPKRVVIATLD